MSERTCTICGCTNTNACVDDRGPCWWVAADRCSHCVATARQPIPVVVCGVVKRTLGLRADKVEPRHDLSRDLHCESMDFVEIALEVEDLFQIEVTDDEAAELATVADWIALVESKLGSAK